MRSFVLVSIALVGCTPARTSPEPTATVPAPAPAPSAAAAAPLAVPNPPAAVGQPAPDFTLKDLDGKDVHLASLRGKTVVLEWFNPGCPYVKAAHTLGSLRDAAARHTAKGVTWLAVNSSGPGREGHGLERNTEARKQFGLAHPIALDETGAVGRLYGATNTPHLFVIDAKGTLVYRGAIDNSPDGEGQSPTGPKLVRHVDDALADLAAGRPVAVPETKAYGCSVKYAK